MTAPYYHYWGKAKPTAENTENGISCHLLPYHSLDVAAFAESFQQLRPDLRQQFWPNAIIKKKNYSVRHDSLGEMLWQGF